MDVFTRTGVERVARYSFELARSRRGRLASITKSNASPHHFVMWDEIVEEVHRDYPDVALDRILVDAAAAYMVSAPDRFDVVVASNLFGDILTDIGAVIQGGMGMAASANITPDRSRPGLFEPVHGSAPDIAGTGRANPVGAVWAGAMMLEHLGEPAAGTAVMAALAEVLGTTPVRTPDLGGTLTGGRRVRVPPQSDVAGDPDHVRRRIQGLLPTYQVRSLLCFMNTVSTMLFQVGCPISKDDSPTTLCDCSKRHEITPEKQPSGGWVHSLLGRAARLSPRRTRRSGR